MGKPEVALENTSEKLNSGTRAELLSNEYRMTKNYYEEKPKKSVSNETRRRRVVTRHRADPVFSDDPYYVGTHRINR